MTQDFAKKKRTTARKKTSKRTNTRRKPVNSKKAPAWAWLVIGLLLAALITLLIYLANQPRPDAEPAQADKTANHEPTAAKPPQPRFDFYEILKDQEIEVPDRSAEIIAAQPENVEYFLQAGSFRNGADADKLRAELLLLNLKATIEPATNAQGQVWHRVIVGPFTSRSRVAKARSILASNQLSPLLLKRKVD